MYEKLFNGLVNCDHETELLIEGASKMRKYWPHMQKTSFLDVLRELKPSNDACESILRFND